MPLMPVFTWLAGLVRRVGASSDLTPGVFSPWERVTVSGQVAAGFCGVVGVWAGWLVVWVLVPATSVVFTSTLFPSGLP